MFIPKVFGDMQEGSIESCYMLGMPHAMHAAIAHCGSCIRSLRKARASTRHELTACDSITSQAHTVVDTDLLIYR